MTFKEHALLLLTDALIVFGLVLLITGYGVFCVAEFVVRCYRAVKYQWVRRRY